MNDHEEYGGGYGEGAEAQEQLYAPRGREWLVIEDSRARSVFAPAEAQRPHGYIPRDVAERLLGRDLGGAVWFTREDGDAMRAHPEWRSEAP